MSNIRRINAQSSLQRRARNLAIANWLAMFWNARERQYTPMQRES